MPETGTATPLSSTTCLIHPARPAKARCPGCGTFYCGECITEHDGRLTCAKCLALEKEAPQEKKRRLSLPLMPVVHLALAFVMTWSLYYFLAKVLASIPDDFHDGTVWEDRAEEVEEDL